MATQKELGIHRARSDVGRVPEPRMGHLRKARSAHFGDNRARGLVRKFLQKELSKKQNPLLQEKLDHLEAETPEAPNAKVKGPLKDKMSKQKKKPKKLKNDRAVLGARVKIYWKTMKEWYSGTITHVDPEDEALTVTYDDGEELTYPPNFKGWRWRLLDA